MHLFYVLSHSFIYHRVGGKNSKLGSIYCAQNCQTETLGLYFYYRFLVLKITQFLLRSMNSALITFFVVLLPMYS